MHLPVAFLRNRTTAWLTVALAVVLGAVIFGLPRPDNPAAASRTGLSAGSWESAQVERLSAQFPTSDVQPAVVVVKRDDGARLADGEVARLGTDAAALGRFAVGGRVVGPQVSQDGTVALVVVPVSVADGDDAVAKTIKDLRAQVRGWPAPLQAQVTGGPAFSTDLAAVFEGADTRLLGVTVGVVAILLLLTYRSPILWIVPLVVVAATEQLTLRAVQTVVPAVGLPLDPGAVTGITSILVFGAATDYALLLIARYREELCAEPDRFAAMRSALRRTAEPVLASGFTVVLAVLTLLLSQQESNRALGVACAVGVLLAMAAALVVLPALLVLPGRGLFWPFVPRVGTTLRQGRIWGRLGDLVARRPALVAVASTLVLVALSAGALGLRTGLSETEQFRAKPEAVVAAQTLARAFPAGTTQPVAVLTTPAAASAVVEAARAVPGVASVTPGAATGSLAQVDVVLTPEPGTAASDAALRDLRRAVAAVPGSAPPGLTGATGALVGGAVAEALDLKDANAQDRTRILPLILVLVALVLVLLLRSLFAPLILVATVIASFFASLGASWLLFENVFGFPALDSGVVLLSFVFLVALGVDYNIFLVTRAREDAVRLGTEAGMLAALRVTGGVITSAGVLLAAVFAVLGVLPLIVLTQIGVIVCVGVLLDTLLVRTVLVPALALTAGSRFWWPAKLEPSERITGEPSDPTSDPSAGSVDGRSGHVVGDGVEHRVEHS